MRWIFLAAVLLLGATMAVLAWWRWRQTRAAWRVEGWSHLGSPPADLEAELPRILERIGWTWGGGMVEWRPDPFPVDYGGTLGPGKVVNPDVLHLRVQTQPTTAATALEHELRHVRNYRRSGCLADLSREPP